VNNVGSNLGTFHRYLRLRARMMGVDTLHYYDLYGPLVKHGDIDYSYEEAEKLVLASLAPLGETTIKVARKDLRNGGWMSTPPTENGRARTPRVGL